MPRIPFFPSGTLNDRENLSRLRIQVSQTALRLIDFTLFFFFFLKLHNFRARDRFIASSIFHFGQSRSVWLRREARVARSVEAFGVVRSYDNHLPKRRERGHATRAEAGGGGKRVHDRERNGTISGEERNEERGEGKAAAIRLDFTDTGGYRTSGRRSIVYRTADAIAITVSARERDARHDVREGKTGREGERERQQPGPERIGYGSCCGVAYTATATCTISAHGRVDSFFFLFYLGTRSYARLSHFSRSR